MRTAVVGLGLIGGSILRALSEVRPGRGTEGAPADVVGHDADATVREVAAADGFPVAGELADLHDRELVIVAVPPRRTVEVVEAVLAAAPWAVVADTASVKAPILAAAASERFVGAHPLAGSEAAGWGASAAGIVAGAVWAVCPAGESLEPLLRLATAVDRLDGRLVACSAAEHDAAVARTSHVPHLAAQALATLAADGGLRAALSGSAFRDMTRVARADAALWAEILLLNRSEVAAALDELGDRLDGLRAALEGGDRDRLGRAWSAGVDALAGVHAARWAEPAWEHGRIEGGWDGLLELGRQGRTVRRLALEDGVLTGEMTR